jgi:dienelactone hydrolase
MKLLVATFVIALLTGCASAPSFPMLLGSTFKTSVTTYNPHTSRVVEVPVVIYKPPTLLPTKPAVIFLSGCDGGHWNIHRELVTRLNNRGVVVAEVKSIEAYGNQCVPPMLASGYYRTAHAIEAKQLLEVLGLANRDNIGIVGLSNGGWTVVNLLSNDIPSDSPLGELHQGKGREFAVGIGLYPYCEVLGARADSLTTPMLLLGGSADKWTPFSTCVNLFENNPFVSLYVYEGATHAWDAPFQYRTVIGAGRPVHLAYDHRATSDSIERSWAFLVKYLKME